MLENRILLDVDISSWNIVQLQLQYPVTGSNAKHFITGI